MNIDVKNKSILITYNDESFLANLNFDGVWVNIIIKYEIDCMIFYNKNRTNIY